MIRSLADIKNRKVLVMGLGTKGGGVGTCRFMSENGAKITVTDLQPKEKLEESIRQIKRYNPKLVLGQHLESDFREHDIIIKNPGILNSNKYLLLAEHAGRTIETPIGIFSELIQHPYIGITGTKGKSYTTHLTHHIVESFGIKSVAAGNNCVSPLIYLDKHYQFVLELSSWQLREMGMHKKSPRLACWLNFFPDHLNFYSGLEAYFADKQNIFENQSEEDIAVVPLSDLEIGAAVGKAQKVCFSASANNKNLPADGCFIIGDKLQLIDDGKLVIELSDSELISLSIAKHHRELLTAAFCNSYFCLKLFFPETDFSKERLLRILQDWKGLAHRFEFVGEFNSLKYINDSAASTPDSVLKALGSISESSVVLIAGGGGAKNLNFKSLVRYIVKYHIPVVLFQNDQPSSNIISLFKEYSYKNYSEAFNMQEAVEIAQKQCKKCNATHIILSPGCSGAPFFTDMFERGELFEDVVQKL